MLGSLTWLLKYSILLVNCFILYLLYKRNSAQKKKLRKKNSGKKILILTAHPDDETMFFFPLIQYLKKEEFEIHVLCMTQGRLDQETSSSTRKFEFKAVMQSLDIKTYDILNLEAKGISDSQNGNKWDLDVVYEQVAQYVEQNGINCVFTFDFHGVSGHCHHSWVSEAVQIQKDILQQKSIKIYLLRSVGIFRKYLLLWDLLCLLAVEFINVLGLAFLGKEIWPQFIFVNFNWR